MKLYPIALLLTAILLILSACGSQQTASTENASANTEGSSQSTENTGHLPGWDSDSENTYYYLDNGTMALGWQEIENLRYYFGQDGAMHQGWLALDGKQYFLGMDGVLRTGWLEADGNRYYLSPDTGAAAVGWVLVEEENRYFSPEGVLQSGWVTDAQKTYYLTESGTAVTGWQLFGENQYYFDSDGVMATGSQEIDGKQYYFSPSGIQVWVANPWNEIPAYYTTELVNIGNGNKISQACYDALMEMFADCRAAGLNPQVASAYRSYDRQVYLYNRKVNYFLNLGYSREAAEKEAGTIVAIPGTSEHQLGLALDLVDNSNWNLDESQEKTPVQQWLMQNSWKYGFILRYPKDKSDVTGIIYEPWHYRYVGKTVAKEVYESGLCLEEYLGIAQ